MANPGRKLVQTALNFHPSRGQPNDDISNSSPHFVRESRDNSSYHFLLAERGVYQSVDIEKDNSSAQVISGPSTTPVSESSAISERALQRKKLRDVAKETTTLLPHILKTTPHALPAGYLYSFPKPPQLRAKYCPGFGKTSIRVLNADSIDTALGLAQCELYVVVHDKRPVCVLNMANAFHPGGGWKNGAVAQEEALCYRTSLSFTLKLRYYPIPELGAIYSPTVLVIRKNMKDGHHLLPLDDPEKLPIISVISMAALSEPQVAADMIPAAPDSSETRRKEKFKDLEDREITKEKIRVILRTAAFNGHRRLVLGALGCGAFLNPREEVADCFAEVFSEQEFSGGWWESIIFAVMDDLGEGKDGNGNFGVFYRRLNGMIV